MYQPNQRVTVDLSNLMIKDVFFSQNVQKAIGTIVQQVSTTPSVYFVEPPSADLLDAARIMHERKLGALPVADSGRVVGMLTATDVIRAVVRISGEGP